LTIYSRLENGLETCLGLTQRLVGVVSESSEALVKCDYQRFTGLAKEQTCLAGEFRTQEQQLRGLLAAAADELSLQGVITLTRVLERIEESSPEASASLQRTAKALRKASRELSEAVYANAALLRNLDYYTRVVFRLLLGFEETSGYGPPTQQPATAVARHLVDRKV
jgi:histidyl-tRNA synthetase